MLRSLRTIRSIPRIKDIAIVLGKHGFHQVAATLQAPLLTTLRRLFKRESRHVVQQPERLRMALEELGPTFIKFGQLLSSRPDFLPPEYIEELGKLQDDVRPEPFEEILSLLGDEYQADPRTLFARIDPVPLASASIAQVHRATTREGEDVVVKVRKRGLERLVRQDIQVLAVLAEFLSHWRGLRLFDPEGVIRLFERSIQRELNFDYERYNIARMRENLSADPAVYVPRVYPDLSRRGVLTLEYLDGAKLTSLRASPLDPARGKALGTSIALSVMRQVFEHGFYHADPHAGNIVLLTDGRVGLLDFGNVGRFTRDMRDELMQLFVALVRRNFRDVTRWVLKRGQPSTTVDAQTFGLELMDTLEPYYGMRMEEIQLGGVINSLFGLMLRNGISIPAPYVHAGRTLVTLEGVVRLCAPRLEVIPAIQPFLARLIQKRFSPERLVRDLQGDLTELLTALRSYPTNLAEVLARAAEGRLRMEAEVPAVEQLAARVEQASNRLQLAVVASGLLISSALLLMTPALGAGSIQRIVGIGAGLGSLLLILKILLLRG